MHNEPDEEQKPHEQYGSLDLSDVSKKAAEMAQAFALFLNLAGGLAAPRVWARVSPPPRDHLVAHADAFLSALNGTSDQQALVVPAQQLRAQLAAWEPGPEVPAELRQGARALLAALGAGEPPEGWDAFDVEQK